MRTKPELGSPPQVGMHLIADRTASCRADEGFLRLRRYELQWQDECGQRSRPYRYDVVDRAALDAVTIVLEANVEERGIP